MAVKAIVQSIVSGGSKDEDAILHKKALKVDSLNDEVRNIIQDLRDTMWAYPFCVGLSAPQIGVSLAISVINTEREDKDKDLIMINPSVISLSGKKDKKRESCMSVWGETGIVERREKLIVEYYDDNFELKTMECKGFLSRCIQHEIDHLEGTLYYERMGEGTKLDHADFFDEYEVIK